jgi:uncharacterized membrane protein
MKIKFLIITALFFFSACNVPKEEYNVPTSKVEILTSLEDTGEDTAKVREEKTVNETSNNDAALQRKGAAPLLTARGSEPGWYAEFYADHLNLVLDYGKDTLKVDHDFSNISKDKTYTAAIANVSNDNGKTTSVALAINIDSKPCTEMSGEKRDRSITLKYNKKEYKGCAY